MYHKVLSENVLLKRKVNENKTKWKGVISTFAIEELE